MRKDYKKYFNGAVSTMLDLTNWITENVKPGDIVETGTTKKVFVLNILKRGKKRKKNKVITLT